jgi:hypothetical protein
MEQKPFYYDGSGQLDCTSVNKPSEPFRITDEMRKNIGYNPYFLQVEK